MEWGGSPRWKDHGYGWNRINSLLNEDRYKS